jgi:hypothetical protein
MVLPLENDVLWTLHRMGAVWLERVVWIVCFLLVLTLLILSRLRIRSDPARWRGQLAHILTACILVLNVVNALIAMHYNAL